MSSKWKKGRAPYSEWLKGLTQAEYDAHLEARAKKRTMKKAMETIVLEQQNEWLAMIHNTAVVLMTKALEEGDHHAFATVYDRLIGKPKDEVQVEVDNEELLKAIIAQVGTLPD